MAIDIKINVDAHLWLWAIAQGLVILYGPLPRIWLSTIGYGAGFSYALWVIAQNQLT